MTGNAFDDAALLLLREALDLDTRDERERLLDERCTDQPGLRERVRAMLARIEADESSLASAEPVADGLIGEHLGPFRVVEAIGRGGMGRVYRGEREGADFQQDVAIKLIRRGFDFDDIRARFLRERRILARLSHPNLARFIDGGVAPDGRPWFALEFVRGQTITHWCDAERLDLRARVKLFIDVCSAVQYAHTQLVVHRDLKPGNVLVDETGSVRLLDFGVAGLLAGDADDAAKPSTFGQHHALTPEYAAPEQLGGEGASVSVDVYSLGVMLYELMAGALPYAIDRHDVAAAAAIVRKQPPQPLAQAIARGADAAPAIVAQRLAARRTTARAYRALVRGDLARILDKALVKEPARRYATVQAFADDLARWLAGAPVHVAGNGPGYRLRKFVGRHRVAVAAASVGVALVIAGVAGTLWQARKASLAATQAQAQASRATAARDFLASLLGQASPEQNKGQETTVREVLERARQRIDAELAEQPDLRVDLSTLIGSVYDDLGAYEQATPLLATAVRIADTDPRIAPATRAHAHAEYAYVLLSHDAGKEAEAQAAVAVDLLRDQPPGAARIAALGSLATARFLQGNFTDALAAQREATALAAEVDGDNSESHASAQLELSYFLAGADQTPEAIATAQHALAILDRLYPDGRQPIVTRALWALGNTLSGADRDAEALPYLRRALDLVEKIYGKDSLKYMRSLQLLAVSELETGAVAAARDHFEQVEKMLMAQAPEHPLQDMILSYYGESLLRNAEPAAAGDVLSRAVEHARKADKTDVAQRSTILLARARLGEGRTDDAARLLDACIPELQSARSKRLPAALVVRAATWRQQGRLAEAAESLAQAQPLLESISRTGRIEGALEQARVADAIGDVPVRRREAGRARDMLLQGGARAAPEFAEAERLASESAPGAR